MEVVISIIAKIAEYTVAPLGHQLGYLFFYKSNVKSLRNEVERLGYASNLVKHLVDEATRNAEDVDANVLNWLNMVNEISKEAHTFHEDGSEAMKINGFNLVQRYCLSRKAKKLTKKVFELKKRGKYERVSHPGSLRGVGSSTIKGYLPFGSRRSTLKEIMKTLTDDTTSMVGIYGMGGVGKTMLVKEIARQVREAKSFDEVVLATVSQIPNIRSIQAQLGDMLGLRFEQESIEGRAALLQKRLMKEKKILIMLDDIWKGLDLETLGIPCSEDHQGCKILFTSRDKHVLSNELSIDKNFHIKILSEEESWDFFKNIVGESIESLDVKPIAAQVVKECKGMPIALATVAKALRGKPLAIWRDALYQLRNCAAMNIKGMNEKVYSSLELSYTYLQSEEAKLLFLLCGMFPEDYQISVEDLCIYSMGMGLLHGVDKLATLRDRVVKLVDDLKSSSLLSESDQGDDRFVKMHDIIRDIAILIASKDDQLCSICYGQGLDEWQLVSDNYTTMFVICDNFHKLPLRLMLPKLELLIMSLNQSMEQKFQISEFTFEGMKKLKVLKLEGICMSTLPSSFSHLVNLQTLYLERCVLGNINIISELRQLEILSFRGSQIKCLPVGMNQLIQLKMLNLCYCTELEGIPPNLISRMKKLEDLNLCRSFVGWERKDLNNERKNATILELKHLPHLTTLYLCIPDSNNLTNHMFSNKLQLERFQIVIGKGWETYSYKTSRMLDLKVDVRIFLNDWLKTLLKKIEELYLEASLGIKDFLSELSGNDYPHCRHLHLGNDANIQYLIGESDKLLCKALCILESLSLSRMMSLQNILDAHLKVVPFKQLRVIKVVECNKLRNIVCFSIMKVLSNLQMIKVYNCEMMEEIVAIESEEATQKIECSQLSSLYLNGLPHLTSFCSKVVRPKSSLDYSKHAEVLEEDKLDNLMPLFNDQVAFPSLKDLKIRGFNWKLIWHNQFDLVHSFCKLKMIDLTDCPNLIKVFPPNMIRLLQSLEVLNIHRCNLLEEIFEIQDSDIKENGNVIATQLRCLDLYDLPNLKCVWSKDPRGAVTFQNLQHVNVVICPKLKSLFPASFRKDLQHLQSLELRKSGSKEIFGKEEMYKTTTESDSMHFEKQCSKMGPTCQDMDHFLEVAKDCDRLNHLVCKASSFRNLCTLRITECDGLINLLSSSMVKNLVQLRRLSLSRCKRMITVLAKTETKGEQEETEVVFSQLEFLGLFDLPKFIAFQSGKCRSGFPSLKIVVIKRCPEMKNFSLGSVSTPKLESVRLTEADEYDWWYPFPNIQSEKCWAGDINATIRRLWEDDSNSYMQHLFT